MTSSCLEWRPLFTFAVDFALGVAGVFAVGTSGVGSAALVVGMGKGFSACADFMAVGVGVGLDVFGSCICKHRSHAVQLNKLKRKKYVL